MRYWELEKLRSLDASISFAHREISRYNNNIKNFNKEKDDMHNRCDHVYPTGKTAACEKTEPFYCQICLKNLNFKDVIAMCFAALSQKTEEAVNSMRCSLATTTEFSSNEIFLLRAILRLIYKTTDTDKESDVLATINVDQSNMTITADICLDDGKVLAEEIFPWQLKNGDVDSRDYKEISDTLNKFFSDQQSLILEALTKTLGEIPW